MHIYVAERQVGHVWKRTDVDGGKGNKHTTIKLHLMSLNNYL